MNTAETGTRLIFRENSKIALGALCMNNDWLLRAKRAADPKTQTPLELEYGPEDRDLTVIYVEDLIAECTYAIVRGTESSKAIRLIRKKVPTWTADDMFAEWRRAPHDTAQILAILRIGVGAPVTYDERFAKHLREGLSSQDHAVREAALAAIGYRDWPEFDNDLRRIAMGDESERCRNRAAYMVEVSERERASAH